MFWDPISAWLVVLLSNSVIESGVFAPNVKVKSYDETENENLNRFIRDNKRIWGVKASVIAFEEIQRRFDYIKKYQPSRQVVIDPDNQEYIIELLYACAEHYRQWPTSEKYREKAEWFQKAANEARQKKDEHERQEQLRLEAAQ